MIQILMWCAMIGLALVCFLVMLLRFVKLSKRIGVLKKELKAAAPAQKMIEVTADREPAQPGTSDELNTLRCLKQMLDEGLITAEDYEEKKKNLLNRM